MLASGALVVVATWLTFVACVVNHNHLHHPMARGRRANRLLGHLLGLARGQTSCGIFVAHVLNHHRHHGAAPDWIRPALAGAGTGPLRLGRYTVRAIGAMLRGRRAADAPVLPPALARHRRAEAASLALTVVVAAAVAGEAVVWHLLLPWLIASAMLVAVNLPQHDRCDPARALGHSRDFTGRLGNWWLLNNGYHTAHHLAPRAHWADLPRLHATVVRPRAGTDREERSLLAYLWRHHGWPARPAAAR
ncbi:MAG: fatty acid desaturase [Ectothiorhodospiraceae bacterium]|nr:fatty acid desaturase [Ectothiorhodospiraceae bacterium]